VTARIIATARIFPETRALLERAGTVLHPVGDEPWDEDQLRAAMAGAEAMMAFMTDRVDAALLDAAPHLRVLACALKGADNIDMEACRARGIAVSIVPDLLTVPTAELAVGLAIGLARHIRAGDAVVRREFRGWRPTLYGLGLDGATIAILGLGRLGKAIAARLLPFGCRLRGVDPENDAAGVDRMALEPALMGADLVIIAVPLTAETRGLVGRDELACLPRGALMVNIGRGSTVDEEAVVEALKAGRLGGYAADVFAMEDWALPDRPRSIPRQLLDDPRTLFTPHLGSATTTARRAIEAEAASNILKSLGLVA
jgi:phosphonate dehydrogenase